MFKEAKGEHHDSLLNYILIYPNDQLQKIWGHSFCNRRRRVANYYSSGKEKRKEDLIFLCPARNLS